MIAGTSSPLNQPNITNAPPARIAYERRSPAGGVL